LDIPPPLAEYFETVAKRERIHEDLLWDKPKLFEWATTAVDEVPTGLRGISRIHVPVNNEIPDDDF